VETNDEHDAIDVAMNAIQGFVNTTPELQGLRLVVIISDGQTAGASHAGYDDDIERVVMTLLKAAQELAADTAMNIALIPMSGIESPN